jgi:hypothetical protein
MVANCHGNGFLTRAQMDIAGQLTRAGVCPQLFFGATDKQHAFEHGFEALWPWGKIVMEIWLAHSLSGVLPYLQAH